MTVLVCIDNFRSEIRLFLCCLYLNMLDSVFDFNTIFRNLSLRLISVLNALVNHGLSLFLTVTNLAEVWYTAVRPSTHRTITQECFENKPSYNLPPLKNIVDDIEANIVYNDNEKCDLF
jgi:hypothetical protein